MRAPLSGSRDDIQSGYGSYRVFDSCEVEVRSVISRLECAVISGPSLMSVMDFGRLYDKHLSCH